MAAKQTDKDFWEKPLSASKVKRILEKRGFNAAAFRKDYEEDTSRGSRQANRPPAKQEIDAVEAFQKTGDVEALKEKLGVKTPSAALNKVSRVSKWKSEGGVKSVIRKGGARRPELPSPRI